MARCPCDGGFDHEEIIIKARACRSQSSPHDNMTVDISCMVSSRAAYAPKNMRLFAILSVCRFIIASPIYHYEAIYDGAHENKSHEGEDIGTRQSCASTAMLTAAHMGYNTSSVIAINDIDYFRRLDKNRPRPLASPRLSRQ